MEIMQIVDGMESKAIVMFGNNEDGSERKQWDFITFILSGLENVKMPKMWIVLLRTLVLSRLLPTIQQRT